MGFLHIAAAIAATIPPTVRDVPSPLPNASPAMWVVNDADTVIYLFGTFHALYGKSDWFNDEVLTAFSQSQELVLETLVPKPPVTGGLSVPGSVAPMAPVAGSASFLSTTKAVMSAGRANGMSTAKGADAVLRDAADGIGKPVSGLETFEFQIGMFSRLPGAKSPRGAGPTQAADRALANLLSYLQSAWNRGDVDSFAPMLEDMRMKSPQTYRVLFSDRNARWADWIEHRLDQPGTVFVAVGAGHLTGRDSVQIKLAGRGIGSARIN